jgi:hypothetical protein
MTTTPTGPTHVAGSAPAVDPASLQLYARAVGGSTPPLLMNPSPDWTVKFFTKLGQHSLQVRLPGTVSAYRSSDGSLLAPDAKLGDLGLLRYEMIEFRADDSARG